MMSVFDLYLLAAHRVSNANDRDICGLAHALDKKPRQIEIISDSNVVLPYGFTATFWGRLVNPAAKNQLSGNV
jgi:hypothetical protein